MTSTKSGKVQVAIIMGSRSDWETMEHAARVLADFGVPHECLVVSAHRTPQWLAKFSATAEKRGLRVIIAGAGGAAHLPGMAAAQCALPVLGVPVESRTLKGLDSLLSIAQMPAGIPVGTLAIGRAGAVNAGLLAVAILALSDAGLREQLLEFRGDQTSTVMKSRRLPGPEEQDCGDCSCCAGHDVAKAARPRRKAKSARGPKPVTRRGR